MDPSETVILSVSEESTGTLARRRGCGTVAGFFAAHRVMDDMSGMKSSGEMKGHKMEGMSMKGMDGRKTIGVPMLAFFSEGSAARLYRTASNGWTGWTSLKHQCQGSY